MNASANTPRGALESFRRTADCGWQRESRRNALKHGLCSRTLLVEAVGREAVQRQLEQLRVEWQPTSPTEELLIRELAAACCRLGIGRTGRGRGSSLWHAGAAHSPSLRRAGRRGMQRYAARRCGHDRGYRPPHARSPGALRKAATMPCCGFGKPRPCGGWPG